MGFPAIRVRAFPGKREEANRAGITPKIRVGTIDLSTARGRRGKSFSRTDDRLLSSVIFRRQTTKNDRPPHQPAPCVPVADRLISMPIERKVSVNGVDI